MPAATRCLGAICDSTVLNSEVKMSHLYNYKEYVCCLLNSSVATEKLLKSLPMLEKYIIFVKK